MNAKDTHKSFQALEILLHGMSLEFCRMYIDCSSSSDIPSAKGFIDWLGKNENESFRLVTELIFNYALAIYVQKVGVRCNDTDLIEAGRMKFMPMFLRF